MKIENELIPKEWQITKIGEILDVFTGSKNAQDSKSDGAYPFFTRSVNTQRIDTYSYDIEALLLAGEGIFKVKYYKGKFDVHQRTYIITAKKNNVSLKFLQNQIQSKIEGLVSTSVGSTVQSLRKPIIQNLKIPLPPLVEQQKIADILSTVDKKIAVIDQQITATEELKKGLMQCLLTKGIGHTEFKDSPLGKIPKSWNYLKISDVGVLSGGYAFKSKEFNNSGNGYQVIRMSNVQPNGLLKDKNPVFIESLTQKEQHFILKEGDILITLTGTIGKKDYGNVAFIKESNTMALNQRVGRFNYNEKVTGLYLFYLFNSENFRKQFFERGKGGTGNQANVGKSSFESIKIVLPVKKSEQKYIAEILSNIDSKLNLQHLKIKSFLQLKKGLMQQLLTGKIRVNNLVEA